MPAGVIFFPIVNIDYIDRNAIGPFYVVRYSSSSDLLRTVLRFQFPILFIERYNTIKINVCDYLMWLLMEGNRIKDTYIELRMEKASGKEIYLFPEGFVRRKPRL